MTQGTLRTQMLLRQPQASGVSCQPALVLA
ncbi:uncharacterized protein CCOS01_15058 [Colletotrichum costaricense]|uniref:Uncharacterized protein n=2 Tax=Colletotrichum acutatum species complex TaxID=2707335 RepID=A0AAI9YIZ5_9PEZI|nr:uncharacterized protein CCOS01_15058 [Colletotrichum costaricense]XP_060380641.1 uncharacterized protein CTAM01_08674 [Colletotrichum tamarilloi]KAK1495219.1 hypothetical protein CTAM01_08674 [Colletotrichum tamarilloi]KAK1511296.1 hypothetical protein CCOS01_15058 [Colletotrichum costaricense]